LSLATLSGTAADLAGAFLSQEDMLTTRSKAGMRVFILLANSSVTRSGLWGDHRPAGDQGQRRPGRKLLRDFLPRRVYARWKDGRSWNFRLDRVKG
jgi:hypothetical protein